MSPQPTPQQQRVVWWILWAVFQIGIVVIYFFLGKPMTSVPTSAFWQVGFFPVLISGAVRWSVLPQFKDAPKALPIFIIGIALAELSCFLGLFVFPAHRLPLFIASVIGIFQFIPIYFGRYFGANVGE